VLVDQGVERVWVSVGGTTTFAGRLGGFAVDASAFAWPAFLAAARWAFFRAAFSLAFFAPFSPAFAVSLAAGFSGAGGVVGAGAAAAAKAARPAAEASITNAAIVRCPYAPLVRVLVMPVRPFGSDRNPSTPTMRPPSRHGAPLD